MEINDQPGIFQAMLEKGAADGVLVSRLDQHAEVIVDLKTAAKAHRGEAANGFLGGRGQADQPAMVSEGDDVELPLAEVVPPGMLPHVSEEDVVFGGALLQVLPVAAQRGECCGIAESRDIQTVTGARGVG